MEVLTLKKLFLYANRYVQKSDWKDLALIKLCLCALGVIIGLSVPKEARKYPLIIAAIVFVVTYISLMAKFFRIVNSNMEITE